MRWHSFLHWKCIKFVLPIFHTKEPIKTVAEGKDSYIIMFHNILISHMSTTVNAHPLYYRSSRQLITFSFIARQSVCGRCHWTGWYKNSRTSHTTQSARENRSGQALQTTLISWSLWLPLCTQRPPSLLREPTKSARGFCCSIKGLEGALETILSNSLGFQTVILSWDSD